MLELFGRNYSLEVQLLLSFYVAGVAVILFGKWFIPFIKRSQILEGQAKNTAAKLDELHAHKAKTPTFGGVMILGGVFYSVLFLSQFWSREVILLVLYSVGLATIGFIDDVVKLTRKRGISARIKLHCQVLLSGVIAIYLYKIDPNVSSIFVPFTNYTINLGILFVPFAILVLTGTTNAVNLTDGLDGLAMGAVILTALPLMVCALLYDLTGVAVFLTAVAGAGLGFLWFNYHPAKIFMGDTGALALGGILGLSAVLCRQELILLIAGGVFVIETLSVILQVLSFRLTGKHMFLIAPLHHHFQYKGWHEMRITTLFWKIGAVLAIVSASLLFIEV